MNINIKSKLSMKAPAMIAVIAIAALLTATSISSVVQQAAQTVSAQSLNVTKQTSYVSDINVHFKTFCISVIIVTACW